MATKTLFLKDLRVSDLKAELEKRQMATSGVKAVLVDRLAKHLAEAGHEPETFNFAAEDNTDAVDEAPVMGNNEKISNNGDNDEEPEQPAPEVEQASPESAQDIQPEPNETEVTENPVKDDHQMEVDAKVDDRPVEQQPEPMTDLLNTDQLMQEEEALDFEDPKDADQEDEVKVVPDRVEENVSSHDVTGSEGQTGLTKTGEEDSINLMLNEDEEDDLFKEDVVKQKENTAAPDDGPEVDTKEPEKAKTPEESKAEDDQRNDSAVKNDDKIDAANDDAIDAKKADREKSSSSSSADGGRSLWISGLSADTRATDLKNTFSKFGKVVGAKVVTNAKTPGARCFGYVTMGSAEEAAAAIKELHKTELWGRVVTVEKAKADKSGPMAKLSSEQKSSSSSSSKNETTSEEKKSGEDKSGNGKTSPTENERRRRHDESSGGGRRSSDPRSGRGTSRDQRPVRRPSPRRGSPPRRSSPIRRRSPGHRSRTPPRHDGRPVADRLGVRRSSPRRSPPRRSPSPRTRVREQREREEERRRRHRERERREQEEDRLRQERELLRKEREKLEREKLELLRLERERLEREKEELERLKRQQAMRSEETRRAIKRPIESSSSYYDDRKRSDSRTLGIPTLESVVMGGSSSRSSGRGYEGSSSSSSSHYNRGSSGGGGGSSSAGMPNPFHPRSSGLDDRLERSSGSRSVYEKSSSSINYDSRNLDRDHHRSGMSLSGSNSSSGPRGSSSSSSYPSRDPWGSSSTSSSQFGRPPPGGSSSSSSAGWARSGSSGLLPPPLAASSTRNGSSGLSGLANPFPNPGSGGYVGGSGGHYGSSTASSAASAERFDAYKLMPGGGKHF